MAALHILSYHLFYGARAEAGNVPAWIVNLAERGYTSTSLFFILSGFVLTYAYSDDESGFKGERRSFWIGRFARLYPLLVVTYLISLPLSTDTALQAVIRAVLTLSVTQAWVPVPGYALGSVSWSLSALALFYAVTPALLVRLRRMTNRQLGWALAAVWGISLVGPALLLAWSDQPVTYADTRMQFLHTFPLLRLPEFAFGVVLGKLFVRTRETHRRRAAGYLAVAVAGLLAVFLFGAPIPYPLLHNGLVAPLHALLIVGLASGGGVVARLLSSTTMRELGTASLPFYMLHLPLLTYVQMWAGGPGSSSARYMAVVLAFYLALLIALSLATWRWLVEPAAKLIKRRLAPPRDSARVLAIAA